MALTQHADMAGVDLHQPTTFSAADQVIVSTAAGAHGVVTLVALQFLAKKASGAATNVTAAEARAILNVEDGADVTDATNVNTAGAVMESDFNAHTILAATADNTPAALTVAEQTVIGRITGGNIAALSAIQLRTLANVEDGADVTDAANVAAAGAVMETDYNAHTVLAATADDTPAALTVAEQTFVGRKTGGNIAALTATEARAILNVEDGADSTQNALESAPMKELLSDGDLFAILDTMEGSDSSEGEAVKVVSFSDLKAALKTYLDTLYAPL